ncbi:MAG: hypothetical protein GX879_08060, partial [Bacteroidales bacterium]|nr:hypothetical protein [Bacteroidales bacterium]
MRKVFVIFGVVLLVLACKNKSNDISKTELRTDIINEINLIERDLHADLYLDYDKAKNALNAYDKFINAFPNDSLSAEYLFRSAEIALALNNVNLAKTNLANIVYNYKTYVNYELSIFY